MGEQKTAFVFRGGGSKGAVQVGMLKALFEEGIIPDFLVGVSVGSINATKMVELAENDFSQKNLMGVVEQMECVWLKIKSRYDILNFRPYKELFKLVRCRASSLFYFSPTLSKIIDGIDFQKVKKSKMELFIISALRGGGEKESSNFLESPENLKKALIASISIPGFSQPVKIDGKYCHDAVTTNPMPLGTVCRKEAERVYILSCSPKQNSSKEVPLWANEGNWIENFKLIGDIGSDKISQMEREWARRINQDLKVSRMILEIIDSVPSWLFPKKMQKIRELMDGYQFSKKRRVEIIELEPETLPLNMEAFKFQEKDIAKAIETGYESAKKALSK